MEAYQERVVIERRELSQRFEKLATFVNTPEFAKLSLDERKLLNRQYSAMQEYLIVLDERIARWGLET